MRHHYLLESAQEILEDTLSLVLMMFGTRKDYWSLQITAQALETKGALRHCLEHDQGSAACRKASPFF